jgi:hypothetical protein
MSDRPSTGKRPSVRLRNRGVALALVGAGIVAAYLLAWALYWPANGPATGIQQPLYYNESYIWPMAWTLHQAAPGVPPPAPLTLHEGDVARQEVRAAADHLAAVRLWLAGERGGERVEATLSDAQGETVYAGRFQLDGAGAGRTYWLSFAPIVDAEGREYTLGLRAQEGTVLARVGYVDRLPGRLRLNEFPTPGDLDLTLYHRGRPGTWTARAIGERILPGLMRARLRQYKPALFKGATFGLLLLALTAGVGLLLGALALPLGAVLSARKSPWVATGLALIGLMLAALLVFRWDVAGMIGLGRSVRLDPVSRPQPSSFPVFQPSSPPASVRDLVARLAFVGRAPEPRQVATRLVELGGRRRACIAVPARSQVTYGLRVPYDGALRVGYAAPPEAPQATVYEVQIEGQTLLKRALGPGKAGAWYDETLDLRPYAGRLIYLTLATRPADTPPGFEDPGDRAPSGGPLPVAGLWAAPHVVSARSWLLPYPPAESPQHAQIARFGGPAGSGPEIELLGYDREWLEPSTGTHPHGALRLTFYWRALRPVQVPYTVFVHALDAAGEIEGQWDSEPLGGTYPTDVWPPGAVVRDVTTVPVAEGALPEGLRVAVGLYTWPTMDRLPAYDPAGNPWADGRVMLEVE